MPGVDLLKFKKEDLKREIALEISSGECGPADCLSRLADVKKQDGSVSLSPAGYLVTFWSLPSTLGFQFCLI